MVRQKRSKRKYTEAQVQSYNFRRRQKRAQKKKMENPTSRRRFRHQYVARILDVTANFCTFRPIQPSVLKPPIICEHCFSKIFQDEWANFCCEKGEIFLNEFQAPAELFELYSGDSALSREFRHEIRSYNHVFSFTSMGVNLDNQINSTSNIYTYRVHGTIYHRIGTFYPTDGHRPRFLQLLFYDTENELENRWKENRSLNIEILSLLTRILNRSNPFMSRFRQIATLPDILDYKLVIKELSPTLLQYSAPSASQVAAILVNESELHEASSRHIIVHPKDHYLEYIKETSGYYDPLQYPLLLPYGTYGWQKKHRDLNNKKISCRDFYAYHLQIRPQPSILLYGGRLFQQYCVDNYVKIESGRLRYYRKHQAKFRQYYYQGLLDSYHQNESNLRNIGMPVVLPSSFLGSPRDMFQRYQDAMALVQQYGKPDIFITMTCNPSWQEIQDELLPGQIAQDRPDLLTRIFRAKCEELQTDIYKRGIFGKVIAHVHVIEFQKRGLPHIHMLIILDNNDKLRNVDDYDSIVSAELPNACEFPELHNLVVQHMIHGPCGQFRHNAPCMHDGTCKKKYPRQFCPTTEQNDDSYPIYRRRDNGYEVQRGANGNFIIDNRWVVPYNPWLLLKYNCHINVEICASIKSIKYLYKYVYKGPDRIACQLKESDSVDEISNYVDGRFICAPEALWRIYKFPLSKISPSVVRLQIHLPNKQYVMFADDDTLANVLSNLKNKRSMLTEFFRLHRDGISETEMLYRECPLRYKWNKSARTWERRKKSKKIMSRIYFVSPSEGERYYLRLLLHHIRGPKSFDDLLTIAGTRYSSFKDAAVHRGLLHDNETALWCLREACAFKMPSSLRLLFVTILINCDVSSHLLLWNEAHEYMKEDYKIHGSNNEYYLNNRLLHDLNVLLIQHGRSINEYDLPQIDHSVADFENLGSFIDREMSRPILHQDIQSIGMMNSDQRCAFETICNCVMSNSHGIFFVDGPGGTGKTFLYRAIIAHLRSQGFIVIATATSGIAATLLPGGRTAHKMFNISIRNSPNSFCSIPKQSDLAKLIKQASLIVWDEAPMANRQIVEMLDRSMRDILDVEKPFGGKVIVFGGDFRQVLPVVVSGTRAQCVQASLISSPLWKHVQVLQLTQNMRASTDMSYAKWLLDIGDGNTPTIAPDFVHIPDSMCILDPINQLDSLIKFVFPELSENCANSTYMSERAIITSLNDDVNFLNDQILGYFPGEAMTYYSYDSVLDDTQNLYTEEFLNALTPGNLPPHILTLKIGAPIMLLRNLDANQGLCNGTRLLCRRFSPNMIDAEIMHGEHSGNRVFIPRIPMKSAEDSKLSIQLIRKQFPVRLAFALTINKSQGQTIPVLGIYLRNHVFSHGQLYVALSRGIAQNQTKVLVLNNAVKNQRGVFTRNIVYQEIYRLLGKY